MSVLLFRKKRVNPASFLDAGKGRGHTEGMSVTPLPVHRVQVYEILNITRLESLLTITSEEEGAVRARLRASPPPEASAWDIKHDDVSVTLLGANLSMVSAREFIALYLENMRPRTWKYRVWDLER
jgi:hypothetical protein